LKDESFSTLGKIVPALITVFTTWSYLSN